MAEIDIALLQSGGYYLNERTGRTHKRMPAGGVGGGVTGVVDEEASESEHLAFLRLKAQQEAAESEAAEQQAEEPIAEAEEPAEEPDAAAEEPQPEYKSYSGHDVLTIDPTSQPAESEADHER